MGAALVAMVAGLTIGKKKYAEVEAEMQAIRVIAENLRKELGPSCRMTMLHLLKS